MIKFLDELVSLCFIHSIEPVEIVLDANKYESILSELFALCRKQNVSDFHTYAFSFEYKGIRFSKRKQL